MRANIPWAEPLQISLKAIEEWKAIAPKSASLTFWCLETGRISIDSYMEWARNYYELIEVTPEYFELTLNQRFWKQIKTVANWSPALLPLEQWDGVLFVGCVEPDPEVQWSFPVRYILCDPRFLNRRWTELNADLSLPPMKKEATNTGQMQSVLATATSMVNPRLEILKPQGLSDANATPEAESEPLPSVSLQLETNVKADMSKPAGLNLNLGKPKESLSLGTPEQFAKKVAIGNLDLGKLQLGSVSVNPPKTESAPPPQPNPPPAPTQLKPIPRPAAQEPTSESPKESTQTRRSRLQLEPKAATPVYGSAVDINGAPDQIEAARDQKAAVAWCFRQLKSRFSSVIVLVLNEEGLKPWKWESSIKPLTDPAQGISFESPSLFRVAARTLRPYHGFVVESPAHKVFFKAWGFAALPKHVTAIPVSVNGTLRGLFVCISNDQTHPLDVLEYAEMTVDKTVRQLGKTESPFTSTKAA